MRPKETGKAISAHVKMMRRMFKVTGRFYNEPAANLLRLVRLAQVAISRRHTKLNNGLGTTLEELTVARIDGQMMITFCRKGQMKGVYLEHHYGGYQLAEDPDLIDEAITLLQELFPLEALSLID